MDKLNSLIEDENPQFIQEELEDLIKHRVAHLTDYQDGDYADRYRHMVNRVYKAEKELGTNSQELTKSVAHVLAKLMAYKDEYEVARLYSDPAFKQKLDEQFEDGYKLTFHLAPPLLSEKDPKSGHMIKQEFGPWMMKAFGFLAKFKHLRGGKYDIFGKTEERKMERALVSEYMGVLEEICQNLHTDNLELAVQIADLPRDIRGFGHVKEKAVADVKKQEAKLLAKFRNREFEQLAAQ